MFWPWVFLLVGFVNLALAYSLAEGEKTRCYLQFSGGEDCVGSRGDFIVRLSLCAGLRPTGLQGLVIFSVLGCSNISRWTAEVSCPVVSQPVWRAVQDAWDVL